MSEYQLFFVKFSQKLMSVILHLKNLNLLTKSYQNTMKFHCQKLFPVRATLITKRVFNKLTVQLNRWLSKVTERLNTKVER